MIFNSWDKNDRKDATVIMYLLTHGMSKAYYDPLVNNTMDIQELSNTYYQISLARSRCYHSLVNHYITLYFPEIEKYYHNSRSQWFCNLLLKYPTPSSIYQMRKSTFVKRSWNVVGRKVNKQQFLEEFYEMAGLNGDYKQYIFSFPHIKPYVAVLSSIMYYPLVTFELRMQ